MKHIKKFESEKYQKYNIVGLKMNIYTEVMLKNIIYNSEIY